MPATTANVVARSRPSEPSRWTSRRKPTTGPRSARMFCQASVRTRYVTKKGATMNSRKRFRQGPALNAIQ
jgi:hypothetical protein